MRVTFTGAPTPDQAQALFAEIFEAPGTYVVEPMLKATAAAEDQEPFPEWFLARLEEITRERAASAREAIWSALEQLLQVHGVTTPSELDFADLHQALFDLSHASTARMVGIDVRPDVSARLVRMGFRPPEVLDFPGWAYRMGRIYDRLNASNPVPFSDIAAAAREYPLARQEIEAINHVRQRGAMYLRPIFDQTGQVWAVERDQEVVRDITERAIANRTNPIEAARELARSNRAKGLFRDTERVLRTEIAEARSTGSWLAMAGSQPPTAKLYRRPSPRACSECRRLFLDDNGKHRLYERSEIEAQDALGPNTSKPYHLRIGVIHPNCVCSPWLVHYPLRAAA